MVHYVHAPCMPFSGMAGLLIVSIMAAGAVGAYVLLYVYQHYRTGRDERPVKVFVFDVSKILISQSGAWIVNLAMTTLVVQEASRALGVGRSAAIEGIAWYASIFMLDCLVGVPLGLVLGKCFNQWCRWYLRRRQHAAAGALGRVASSSMSALDIAAFFDDGTQAMQQIDGSSGGGGGGTASSITCFDVFCAMNATYGKYGPHHGEINAEADEAALRWSWWGCQLCTWTVCVALSRFLSGLVAIASFGLLRNGDNVVLTIANSITEWNASCAVKQWVVAGALRVTLDVGQIALIDIFNRLDTHYRAAYHRI